MRAAAVALSLCLLLSGCRKKTAPEFYRLDGDYSVLVSREGDDAYGTPELTAIIAGLQAIPSDAVERPRAEALLAKIDAEAQRVKKERADTAIAAVPKPTVNPDALYAGLQQQRVEEAALAAQVLDAGATAKKLEPVIPQVFTGRKLKALPTALRAMEALPTPLAKALKRRIAP